MPNVNLRAALLAIPAILALAGCGQGVAFSRGASPAAPTAILGAMTEEVRLIGDALADKKTVEVEGVPFTVGRLGDRPVVLVKSGAGKTNAALTATLLVSRFHPREAIFTGLAGGLHADMHPGDIVLAARIAFHDFGDITEKGFQPDTPSDPVTGARLPAFYKADAHLLALAEAVGKDVRLEKMKTSEGERQPTVRTGLVATGDVFIAASAKKAELRQRLQADAVEMEGAAVAQVCYRLKVPCLVIRSISDSADASAQQDFYAFMRAACANSATLVIDLAKRLGAEPLPQGQ